MITVNLGEMVTMLVNLLLPYGSGDKKLLRVVFRITAKRKTEGKRNWRTMRCFSSRGATIAFAFFGR